MKPGHIILLIGLCLPILARAETVQQILQTHVAEAAASSPGFIASAARGKTLFENKFGVSEKMPACTSCHTAQPTQNGRHAITGKTIQPLAPAANAERFTDPAKVAKWFRRNCKEVIGRECTPAEKADFIQFLLEVPK